MYAHALEEPAEADSENRKERVVIVGGGFGGLYAARRLAQFDGEVTLIDRRNFHLFQPLLYQVATGGLSPAEIASPLRSVLRGQRNTRVLQGEVADFDLERRRVILSDGEVPYDRLTVAAGAVNHFFGHPEWAETAPGLKTLEDALEMRRRVFSAFENAERETDPQAQAAWLTFVVVGAGPTGVELAGALAELAHHTLKHDFRSFDPTLARVLLLEGGPRILPAYPEALSHSGLESLEELGVEVRTGVQVTAIDGAAVTLRVDETEQHLNARTVLWAAGMRAAPLGQKLADRAGVEPDRGGRIVVQPDLTVPGHPEVYVIGDLAQCAGEDGKPLPGVAPVAMQQGRFVADRIVAQAAGRQSPTRFRYHDKGSLAVIGRNAAVAAIGRWKLRGFPAWLVWMFVHILYLVEFDNQVVVLFKWAWSYVTRNRGARLITPVSRTPVVAPEAQPIRTTGNGRKPLTIA